MIAPSAVVQGATVVPLSCSVWHFSVIGNGVTFGDGCSVGSHAEIGHFSRLGHRVRIGKGVFLPRNSSIGNDVFIGPNATFCDDKRPKSGKGYDAQPPVIEDGASIGAGAVILPGVRIGKDALVGAGAVVTKDVPAGSVVVGNPARVSS